MATIEKYKGKKQVSYRITVSHGGEIYRTRFKPDPSLTEEQADKAAEMEAFEFEMNITKGYKPDNRQTVQELIDYVLEAKQFAGRKEKTIESYKFVVSKLPESFLNRRVVTISTSDIQELLILLRDQPSGQLARAKLKDGIQLWPLLKERNWTKTKLLKVSQIAESTLDKIFSGKNVLLTKAEAVSKALCISVEEIFDIVIPEKAAISTRTLQLYRSFLSLIFGVAVHNRIIAYNPASMLEKMSGRKVRKKPKTLQIDEVQEVLNAAKNEPIDKQCLIQMFLITGCRRGEVAGMKWDNLDCSYSTILVDSGILYSKERGNYEDTTKSDNVKLIKLPKETIDLLKQYKKWQKKKFALNSNGLWEQKYLFTNCKGGIINPDTIYGYIRRFEQKYGLPHIHPHKFRHTMASLLIYAGSDIVSVSKRLGHANVSTTQDIYSHLILKADVESAEHIADIVFRGKKSK